MSDKVEVNNGGVGLCSILTIIFVIAKLVGYVHWSWWLVFAPTIIGFALWLIFVVLVLAAAGIAIYFGGE